MKIVTLNNSASLHKIQLCASFCVCVSVNVVAEAFLRAQGSDTQAAGQMGKDGNDYLITAAINLRALALFDLNFICIN